MTQQATGFTIDYTNPSSIINLPQAWVQITNILYVPYSYTLIVFDIYEDFASFESGMDPVFPNLRGQINYLSADWDNYFDPTVMDLADHNILTQGMTWLEANVSNIGVKK